MLAYEETGKYVSKRHAEASAEGKLTAGNVAAIINRRFKPEPKVTAKELKEFAPEWHHSGFYKGSNGSTMGRTYFFPADTDFDELFQRVCKTREYNARIEAEADIERYFFSAGFERLHRRSRWDKAWRVYAVFEAIQCKPSMTVPFEKKEEISREDYEVFKKHEEEDLEAYESFQHFKDRMLSKKEVA